MGASAVQLHPPTPGADLQTDCPCYRGMDQLHQIQQGAEAATITNDMAHRNQPGRLLLALGASRGMRGARGGGRTGSDRNQMGTSQDPAIAITMRAANEITRESDGDAVRCDFASRLPG